MPEKSILISPFNESVVASDSVEFKWNESAFRANKYWFEYSTDSLFSESVIDSNITDTTKSLVKILENNQYWWRVKAKNDAGWGPFSNTFTFSILITNLMNDGNLPSQYSLSQNYPNPFNPSTTINFSLPKASNVEFTIYNLLGEKIRDELKEYLTMGNYRLNVDLHDLPSGIYVYKLHTKDFTQVRKMMLLK